MAILNPMRCYRNPPIQEAVCSITLVDEALSEDHLNRMQEEWTSLYPKQRINKEEEVQLQMALSQATVKSNLVGHRLICQAENNERLVQLGPKALVVNQLAPYPGWKAAYKQLILDRHAEVRKTLGLESVKNVGLRYINLFVFPAKEFHWEEWFEFQLPVPRQSKSGSVAFQMQFQEHLAEGLFATINIQRVFPPPHAPGAPTVVLDIEVKETRGDSGSGLIERLEDAHGLQCALFESYIKDTTRTLLDLI